MRLLIKAQKIANNMKTLFGQLSDIDRMVNHCNFISEDKIMLVDSLIKRYLESYRFVYPHARTTLKIFLARLIPTRDSTTTEN